jgi:prepilin-type N-terminal cleavage/methylation domain-containing protein
MYIQSKNKEKGFTLIELLTTIVVVGVLSAISLTHFTSYKANAFNARARSDLRNAIAAQELINADISEYISCSNAECEVMLPDFTLSEGVSLNVVAEENNESFEASASHISGSETYFYNSMAGFILE